MTRTASTSGPAHNPEQFTELERGKKLVDELNTLQINDADFDAEEQKMYKEHQQHLVDHQARAAMLVLQAQMLTNNTDALQTLQDEITRMYHDDVYERGEIGLKGVLYSTFGRVPDTNGDLPPASLGMQRCVDRVEDADVPGCEETASFLQELAAKLDPDNQESDENRYIVFDPLNPQKRISYNINAVLKDLHDLRDRAHTLSQSLPPDHVGRNVILKELRTFEQALVAYTNLDPGMKQYMERYNAMNAKDPKGFIPAKAAKTLGVALLGGLTVWALLSRNFGYAAVTSVLLYFVLYGKHKNEYEALAVLRKKNLQSSLTALAAEVGDPLAKSALLQEIIAGEDSDALREGVKGEKISDELVDSLTNVTLKTRLKAMGAKERAQWLAPFLELEDENLEAALKYIENKGQPPLATADLEEQLKQAGMMA